MYIQLITSKSSRFLVACPLPIIRPATLEIPLNEFKQEGNDKRSPPTSALEAKLSSFPVQKLNLPYKDLKLKIKFPSVHQLNPPRTEIRIAHHLAAILLSSLPSK